MALTLPVEILTDIANLVESQEDLFHLISSCRQFYAVLLPCLYASIRIEDGWKIWRLCPLVHTILRKPMLAGAVRHLRLTEVGSWSPEKAPIPVREMNLEYDSVLLGGTIEAVSRSEEERAMWDVELRLAVEDAWVALLLINLPNLWSLELQIPYTGDYLMKVLQRAVKGEKPFNTRPLFPSLIYVSLMCHDGMSLTDIMPFFKFPSIRKFVGHNISGVRRATERSIDFLSTKSSITEIELNGTPYVDGPLSDLITSCPSLQSFRYAHAVESPLFDPATFRPALTSVKDTLHTLFVDYWLWTGIPTSDRFLNRPFGSMVEFTELKNVHLRLYSLLDFNEHNEPTAPLINLLPSSLESLSIGGCDKWGLPMLLSQLLMLLADLRAHTPKLVKLQIEGDFYYHQPWDGPDEFDADISDNPMEIKPEIHEITEPLRLACVEAGIDFRLRDRFSEDLDDNIFNLWQPHPHMPLGV